MRVERTVEEFCKYCQVHYIEPHLLKKHVLKEHPESVRAFSYEMEERALASDTEGI